MNNCNLLPSVSPTRWAAFFLGVAAIWLFQPEIANAAVAFGDIGQNVAENAKGVAKGVTMGGYAAGATMGVWGCIEMHKASHYPGVSINDFNRLYLHNKLSITSLLGFQ